MNATRTTSVAAGTLFLVATASVLAADAVRPALSGAGYLAGVTQHPTRLAVAALLYLTAAGGSVGIAVALYPLIRTVSAAQALGSVVFRTVEAVFYAVAVVSLLSVSPLADQWTTATGDRRETLRLLADSLVAQRERATLAGVFAFCVGALLYYVPLWRSGLVPRWLTGWGVAAIVLMFTACVLALVTGNPVTGYWPLALAIAVQEIVLAIWLLLRGFEPGPPAEPRADALRSCRSRSGRAVRRPGSAGPGPSAG